MYSYKKNHIHPEQSTYNTLKMPVQSVVQLGENEKITWCPGLWFRNKMTTPEVNKIVNKHFEPEIPIERDDEESSNINENHDVLIINIDGPDSTGKSELIEEIQNGGLETGGLFTTMACQKDDSEINIFSPDDKPTYVKLYDIYNDISSKMKTCIDFMNDMHEEIDSSIHVPILIVERGLDGLQFITDYYGEKGELELHEKQNLTYQQNQCFIPSDKTILLECSENSEGLSARYNNNSHSYIKQASLKLNYKANKENVIKQVKQMITEEMIKFKKNRDKKKRSPIQRRTMKTRSMSRKGNKMGHCQLQHGRTGSLRRI